MEEENRRGQQKDYKNKKVKKGHHRVAAFDDGSITSNPVLYNNAWPHHAEVQRGNR
tara:strand:+ start:694 stop:861 length:168 start_codon:yes stop_codon:yes gene_type:complete